MDYELSNMNFEEETMVNSKFHIYYLYENIQYYGRIPFDIYPLIFMSCCSSAPCAFIGKVLLVLLVLTEIAALMAVYNALFGTGGASFGSTTGSLSIMAFAINTAVLTKCGHMHSCGTCEKKK